MLGSETSKLHSLVDNVRCDSKMQSKINENAGFVSPPISKVCARFARAHKNVRSTPTRWGITKMQKADAREHLRETGKAYGRQVRLAPEQVIRDTHTPVKGKARINEKYGPVAVIAALSRVNRASLYVEHSYNSECKWKSCCANQSVSLNFSAVILFDSM